MHVSGCNFVWIDNCLEICYAFCKFCNLSNLVLLLNQVLMIFLKILLDITLCARIDTPSMWTYEQSIWGFRYKAFVTEKLVWPVVKVFNGLVFVLSTYKLTLIIIFFELLRRSNLGNQLEKFYCIINCPDRPSGYI